MTLARLPLLSLAFVLLLARAAYPAEELLPTTFVVYSKNNDQVIHGECITKQGTSKLLSCTFSHFSIYPPEPLSNEDRLDLKFAEYGQHPEPAQLAELKSILRVLIDDYQRQLKQEQASSSPPVATQEKLKQYQGMLRELEKEPSKARSEIDSGSVFTKDTQSSMSKAFAQVLADPSTGPKRKELTRQLLEAVSARDFAKMAKLMQEQQERTCGSWLDTYSLEFQKIGKGKWLSNEGPQGLCRTVTIYELDADRPRACSGLSPAETSPQGTPAIHSVKAQRARIKTNRVLYTVGEPTIPISSFPAISSNGSARGVRHFKTRG